MAFNPLPLPGFRYVHPPGSRRHQRFAITAPCGRPQRFALTSGRPARLESSDRNRPHPSSRNDLDPLPVHVIERTFMRRPLAALALAAWAASPAFALPPGFTDDLVHTGLTQPTAMLFTPDGRMLVGERTGAVRVIENNVVLSTPALVLPVETFEEQGLLGLALHPDFPDSNWLYVSYTRYTGRINENFNLVSRFRLTGNVADPATEQIVIGDIPTGHGYHVAGDIHFAPDGHLFVATGENGWGENYPLQNHRLEGKLLRLRATGGAAPGNPLIGVSGARPEIWHLGFRNPFKFAVHPVTGTPFVADVGETSWEEINAGGPGANFGWPTYEGPAPGSPAWHTNPWLHYSHSGGAALTGLVFYTGTRFPPQYWRNLFFLDHVRGHIGRVVLNPDLTVQQVTFPWGNTSVAGWLQGPIALIVGPDGNLWYNTYSPGHIRRISFWPSSGVTPALGAFDLAPAIPNPSRDGATLVFSLPRPGRARLRILDLAGRAVREVANADFAAGPHTFVWNGRGDDGRALGSGVYFVRLETAQGALTRRLVRTR